MPLLYKRSNGDAKSSLRLDDLLFESVADLEEGRSTSELELGGRIFGSESFNGGARWSFGPADRGPIVEFALEDVAPTGELSEDVDGFGLGFGLLDRRGSSRRGAGGLLTGLVCGSSRRGKLLEGLVCGSSRRGRGKLLGGLA